MQKKKEKTEKRKIKNNYAGPLAKRKIVNNYPGSQTFLAIRYTQADKLADKRFIDRLPAHLLRLACFVFRAFPSAGQAGGHRALKLHEPVV